MRAGKSSGAGSGDAQSTATAVAGESIAIAGESCEARGDAQSKAMAVAGDSIAGEVRVHSRRQWLSQASQSQARAVRMHSLRQWLLQLPEVHRLMPTEVHRMRSGFGMHAGFSRVERQVRRQRSDTLFEEISTHMSGSKRSADFWGNALDCDLAAFGATDFQYEDSDGNIKNCKDNDDPKQNPYSDEKEEGGNNQENEDDVERAKNPDSDEKQQEGDNKENEDDHTGSLVEPNVGAPKIADLPDIYNPDDLEVADSEVATIGGESIAGESSEDAQSKATAVAGKSIAGASSEGAQSKFSIEDIWDRVDSMPGASSEDAQSMAKKDDENAGESSENCAWIQNTYT